MPHPPITPPVPTPLEVVTLPLAELVRRAEEKLGAEAVYALNCDASKHALRVANSKNLIDAAAWEALFMREFVDEYRRLLLNP